MGEDFGDRLCASLDQAHANRRDELGLAQGGVVCGPVGRPEVARNLAVHDVIELKMAGGAERDYGPIPRP
jgi:hypothetical protein